MKTVYYSKPNELLLPVNSHILQLSKEKLHSSFSFFQEENLPAVPYSRILALNKPEWLYVLLGVIAAAVSGGVHPAFAVIFGKIIGVSFCKWAATLNFIHALLVCKVR